eukprot:6644355-Pyramimonas_sp.AAC.1
MGPQSDSSGSPSGFSGFRWALQESSGHARIPQDPLGFLWAHPGSFGFVQIPLDTSGLLRTPEDSTGFPRTPPSKRVLRIPSQGPR